MKSPKEPIPIWILYGMALLSLATAALMMVYGLPAEALIAAACSLYWVWASTA